MTIDEALEFFKESQPKLYEKLLPLQDVGLGYIRLGQSSNTLSGGEAQRVKLAFFLGKGNSDKGKTLFIFDEPTTGLHFHDIQKLLKALNELIEQGDSVLIIEHNMEVIKSADWIIDLGPEGGEEGGHICFEGTPEEMAKIEGNYTADFLREGDTVFREDLRIFKKDSSWVFEVTGVNEDPTPFILTESDSASFIAENPENEFPKLIEYSKTKEGLHAEVKSDEMSIGFDFVPSLD
jgi:ABC-type multidrug transport system ATPase subunit